MEEYVLGDVKDLDTNLIPSLDEAVNLWRRLSRSGRKFEILYCGNEDAETPPPHLRMRSADLLGYDVAAVPSDYWSIVLDLPTASWALVFRQRLNENGLFCSRADAEEYLREYRMHGEPDADSPFLVVCVSRVIPR